MKILSKVFPLFFLGATLIFTACQKDEEPESNNDGAGSALTANSNPQIVLLIDGERVWNRGHVGHANSGYENSIPSLHLFTFSMFSVVDNLAAEMYFKMESGMYEYYDGPWPTDSAFYSYFPAGNYYFTNNPNAGHGIILHYYDTLGNEWSTNKGVADQTGSSFEIVDRIETIENGTGIVKFKANFNCVFYDGNGQSKTATAGELVASFSNL